VSGRPRRGVWRGSCWRDGAETAKQSRTARVRGRATRSDARASSARARRVARREVVFKMLRAGGRSLAVLSSEEILTVCQPGNPNRLLLVVQISRLCDLVPRSMVNTLSHPQDGAPLSDTPPSRS
jgi:hypothetical protein